MKTSNSLFRSRALLMALAIPFFVVGCGNDKKNIPVDTVGSATVGTLFASDGAGGNSAARLYALNPATGATVTNVGAIGYSVTGMAVQPGTGQIYGVTGFDTTGGPSLIRINKSTGVGYLVGSLAGAAADPVADIAFTSNGTLYGWSENSDDLVTINLSTGAATVVADSTIGTSGSGLAASATNVLFFAGDGANGALRTVNGTTGLTTVVATMNGTVGRQMNALAFNGGTLFGSMGGNVGPGAPASLVTINTTTAVVTVLGASLTNMDAIVFNNF